MIKPYNSKRKIYIIDEAEKMNQQAQNAILKTLEEPPSYATIILITSNEEVFLQTIKSRCIFFNTKPVLDEELKNYLMKEVEIPDYQAKICMNFARGNVGRAKALAISEDFEEVKSKTLNLMKHIEDRTLVNLQKDAKEVTDKNYDTDTFLEIIENLLRDILIYKSIGSTKHLIFSDELQYIKQVASELSFRELNIKLEALKEVRTRLAYNVTGELSMEWFLLALKEV